MNVPVHVTVVGENGLCNRHCRTDWMCDMRGTPLLIVREDCLDPDDAEMFAERIGRSMADRKIHGPGFANGLGNHSRRPKVHEWLMGEDLIVCHTSTSIASRSFQYEANCENGLSSSRLI